MNLHLIETGVDRSETLLLLHGFMGRGDALLDLADALSGRFHCILPDLPGHGRSLFEDPGSADGLSSLDDIADLLLDRISGLGIEKFYLYGYSMGGRIAQAVCIRAPERIHHLVLESASFGIREESERQERYEKDCRLLDGINTPADFSRFLEKWHRQPLFCTLRGVSLLDELKASKLENSVEQLSAALRVMSVGHQPWYLPALNGLVVPVTYLYGGRDDKYRAAAESVRGHVPRVVLKEFPHASHNIHLQFLPELLGVLDDLL